MLAGGKSPPIATAADSAGLLKIFRNKYATAALYITSSARVAR
jgi:hypothetical protein